MTTQEQVHSDFSFRLMASYLRFRERFRKPSAFLQNIGVKKGDIILDHGCGIGSYAIPAARMVGPEGKVYALDIHPIAVERTKERAEQAGLGNLEPILSGLSNGLPDQFVDIVLLLDVFKSVQDKLSLLREFHRVLKPSGRLIILIDHESPEHCKELVSKTNLFTLSRQEENILFYERNK